MTYRRRRNQIWFAMLIGAVAIVNILFFLILHRPARAEYGRLQTSIQRLNNEVAARRQTIDSLDRTSFQLEGFDQDRQSLLAGSFLQRDAGYAEIMLQLDTLAQRAGVRKTVVNYGIEPVPQYGLFSVKMRLPVDGSYENVVNFVRALETAKTFYLINAIDVRGGDASSGAAAVDLDLETFFYR